MGKKGWPFSSNRALTHTLRIRCFAPFSVHLSSPATLREGNDTHHDSDSHVYSHTPTQQQNSPEQSNIKKQTRVRERDWFEQGAYSKDTSLSSIHTIANEYPLIFPSHLFRRSFHLPRSFPTTSELGRDLPHVRLYWMIHAASWPSCSRRTCSRGSNKFP